jgi:glycerol-3-phosphate dehydrogenase
MVRTGLSLYALLGGLKRSNRFRSINRAAWEQLDHLNTRGLKHVFQYYDAQTDDAALTGRLIEEAGRRGADIRFSCELLHCDAHGNEVRVSCRQANGEIHVTGKYLINAGGPWVNHVIQRCSPGFTPMAIDLVRGTHIELPGRLQQGIYYLEAPQDRRAVFAMPWRNHIMIGTTETIYQGDPAMVSPTDKEIEYLLKVYNHYFLPPGGVLKGKDVLASWAGLRVLPKSEASPFQRPRETIFHKNSRTNPRIFSIYGGKLTSHYSTARKLLKLLRSAGL